MRHFWHLLKHDFRLLQRNQIIAISILVTIVYVGVFRGLSSLGNMEKVLVLIIYNDPALMGFLFVGVMLLFEKNEGTTEVIAVSPIRLSHYIWSKSMALTIIATFCCLAMAIACYGMDFHFGHLIGASILVTLLFSFIGYGVIASEKHFNTYILKAAGIIILLSLPFLGYFELLPMYWFSMFPTYPGIELFSMAFQTEQSLSFILIQYLLAIIWCAISYFWAFKRMEKNFKQ